MGGADHSDVERPAAASEDGAAAEALDRWEGAAVAEWREAWSVPRLEVYGRIASTNDRARVLAEAGTPGGTVVMADLQTAGRGRRGRRWHAPPGKALMLSVVLRPEPADAAAPGATPLHTGIAVADAIERVTGLRIRLKWPNDLLVASTAEPGAAGRGGLKVGGILCEGALGTRGRGFAVAGIGVNVAQRDDDWPAELRGLATSLELAARRPVARAELAGAVVRAMAALAPRAAAPLDDRTLAAFAERDALRGRRVRVQRTDDAAPLRGRAAGVSPDGSLRIRTDTGLATVRTGTVRIET